MQKESYSGNDYIWQQDPNVGSGVNAHSQGYMYFWGGNKALYASIYDAEGTDMSTALDGLTEVDVILNTKILSTGFYPLANSKKMSAKISHQSFL